MCSFIKKSHTFNCQTWEFGIFKCFYIFYYFCTHLTPSRQAPWIKKKRKKRVHFLGFLLKINVCKFVTCVLSRIKSNLWKLLLLYCSSGISLLPENWIFQSQLEYIKRITRTLKITGGKIENILSNKNKYCYFLVAASAKYI